MHRTVLLAACSAAALMLVTSTAGAHRAPPVGPVIRDCAAHDVLTSAYTVKQLSSALAQMPQDVADYTPCPASIKSQLAGLRARRGKPLGSAVIRDFMKHGSLRYSYGPATLKAALHQIGADAAQYTYVIAAVRSQQFVARRAR